MSFNTSRIESAGGYNGFTFFKDTDRNIRKFTVTNNIGSQEKKTQVASDVSAAMSVLGRILTDAKEGHLLELSTKRLTLSEHRAFLDHGRAVLKATDNLHMPLSVTPPIDFSERLNLLVPGTQFASFRTIFTTLYFLSSVHKISYDNLTNGDDITVHRRIQRTESNWWKNLTPEHIVKQIYEMQQTVRLIEYNPHAIFSNVEALALCHFVAVVAKFGRLVNVS